MKQKPYLQQLSSLPAIIWLYLLGTFLTRGSYYMVWPFLAVILYQQFHLSPTEIGLILSGSAVGSAFMGFYVGNLSDRFGRKPLMLTGGLCGFIAFGLMSTADEVWIYTLAIGLSASSRAMWEPSSKALLGDVIPKASEREFVLHLGYFMTNAGAAIGPLIGIWLGLTAQKETFLITASAYGLLTVSMYIGFLKQSHLTRKQQISDQKVLQTIRLLKKDHLFLWLIIANIIVMFVYAHSDTSLIQYLTQAKTPQLIELITALVITNSVTIVGFQFPLLALLKNQDITNRIYMGLGLLFTSQLFFVYNPTDAFWNWVIAMFILSLGEAILFPTMNIQIDQLAHPKLRGSYFGATSFYSLGFASAPLFGGVIIETWSGPVLYVSTSALILIAVFIYANARRLSRPDFDTLLSQDETSLIAENT